MYDVVVVGAGIIGCSIAQQLSQYQLDVIVLEKECDVSVGTSKANSAIIHAGYDCVPNTLKAKLNVRGNALFPILAKELSFPFVLNGSMVLAFNDEDEEKLDILMEQGITNKVPNLKFLSKEEILKKEPNINTEVTKALYAPSAGIICPYEATLAFAQNAYQNGVTFRFNYKVDEIERINNTYIINHEIQTKYIINAAGIHADDIANLVDDYDHHIIPRKGEYILLDKQENLVSHTLFQVPNALGKGILVTPSVDHNILIGPTATNISNKEDTSFSSEGLKSILDASKKTLPNLPLSSVITNFAGIRAVSDEDFIIEESKHAKNFIHVLGICSPGLASAPAIAEYVIELLKKCDLNLNNKDTYIKTRSAPIKTKELSYEAYDTLVKSQPLYGKIVCRCEMISEQEIIDSIIAPLGATTIDGVKRRVRAGMGRCQGGFCSGRVMELLEEYAAIPILSQTKSGGSSLLVTGKTKGGHHES